MKIFNLPIQCDVSIYQEAILEYVKMVSVFPEVISIVQIGNVGVAGISDIDLIVYLDDTKKCNNNYSLYQISKPYHQILMHDVFIIPYSLMKKSFLITSIFDTKVVYGKELEVCLEDELDKINESLILLNDIAVVSLIHEYKTWHAINKKDIKLIVARLNSIKYPIMLLKRISNYYHVKLDSIEVYDEFVTQFSQFRRDWFLNKESVNVELLLNFVIRAKDDVASNLIIDIVNINKNINVFDCSNNDISFKLGSDLLSGNKLLFLNMLYYSLEKGSISNHIKENIQTNIKINNISFKYELLLKDRIKLINECYDFRKVNKITYGELWTFGKRPEIKFFKRVINKIYSMREEFLKNTIMLKKLKSRWYE